MSRAECRARNGEQGYLATDTSQEEHDFLLEHFPYQAWLGGSDETPVDSEEEVEGVWSWRTGPENGTRFFSAGNSEDDEFHAWTRTVESTVNSPLDGEPSGAQWVDYGDTPPADEDYLELKGTEPDFPSKWNDMPQGNHPNHTDGYIVEFGGLQSMADVDWSGPEGRLTAGASASFDVRVRAAGGHMENVVLELSGDDVSLTAVEGRGCQMHPEKKGTIRCAIRAMPLGESLVATLAGVVSGEPTGAACVRGELTYAKQGCEDGVTEEVEACFATAARVACVPGVSLCPSAQDCRPLPFAGLRGFFRRDIAECITPRRATVPER